MVIENLSPRTITSYLHAPRQLINYWGLPPEKIGSEEIYAFLVYLKEEKKQSRSTIRIAVSGIRYLYRNFLGRSEIVDEIPYPKSEKYLPEILSGKELKCLFDGTGNVKHRVLLKLIYSAGLRVGEVQGIRLGDIDRKNMQIRIRQGKGRKDRNVPLSKHLLKELEVYYRKYTPQTYLFNGRNKGDRISVTAMRWVLKSAIKREGISNTIHLHSLRHSFASHHLSMGTNLFLIQRLLGHESIRTTMVYLHINYRMDGKVKNPLDVMYAEQ